MLLQDPNLVVLYVGCLLPFVVCLLAHFVLGVGGVHGNDGDRDVCCVGGVASLIDFPFCVVPLLSCVWWVLTSLLEELV